jgi:hypothetical protein
MDEEQYHESGVLLPNGSESRAVSPIACVSRPLSRLLGEREPHGARTRAPMSERRAGYGHAGVGGRWRVIVVWSVTAVALPGCNGDQERLSQAEYQNEVLGVVEDAAEPIELNTDLVVEPPPREECATGVATLKDQVDELVNRIAALRPPRRVQAIHDDFVAAARRSVDRIGEVREDVANDELSCGPELNQALYGMPSSRKAERAIARLERRGYFVFGD